MDENGERDIYPFKVIGSVSSCFKTKNGTPRQSVICPMSQAQIRLKKGLFTNPEHAVDGIEKFSHLWILFVFHQNKDAGKPFAFTKAKVRPPRLNGRRVGIFATRSPHRPNPLGLTLAKLEGVCGSVLFISGVDIVDGTPVVDLKPFIPAYDIPPEVSTFQPCPVCHSKTDSGTRNVDTINPTVAGRHPQEVFSMVESREAEIINLPLDKTEGKEVSHVAEWISSPPVKELEVVLTPRAEKGLTLFHGANSCGAGCEYCLKFFPDIPEAKEAMVSLLKADPRSVYRRTKCSDRLYFVSVDAIHLTCWFDEDDVVVEILKIKPVSHVSSVQRT